MEKFGVCFLSVIPLRVEPSDRAEILSQLLFGEAFTLLERHSGGKWMKIRNSFDNYEGWIDFKHVKAISEDEFNSIKNAKPVFVGDNYGVIESENSAIPVFIGTPLPLIKDGKFELAGVNYVYKGKTIEVKQAETFSTLKNISLRYMNAPYLWGGKSLFGIDCSGFVQQAFRLSGYALPRDAYQQAEIGESVNFDELLPGDLVFFSDTTGKIVHVGIMLENHDILHASGQVRIDTLDPKGIFNKDRNEYSHNFHSIKRILG